MKRKNFIKATAAMLFLPSFLEAMEARKPRPEVDTFTPEMLKRNNYGLFIINSKVKKITEKNLGYAATVAWKLGYCHEAYHCGKKGDYGKMNVFTDGWYYPFGNSYEDVCEYLNNNPHGEKYRLMTKEEVIYLITNRKQGFL